MKFNRLVLSGAILALTVGLTTGASAQTTGLKATPSPLNLAARGGDLTSGYITITNLGPGFASNLAASIGPSNGGHNGALNIVGDTCTGATVAQGGTCTLHMEFDAKCFVKTGPAAVWYINVSSSQFPVFTTQVNTTVTSYTCD